MFPASPFLTPKTFFLETLLTLLITFSGIYPTIINCMLIIQIIYCLVVIFKTFRDQKMKIKV